MQKIGLNNTIERISTLPFQKVIDEIIIVEPKSKRMHNLNEVGSDIWEFLSKPHTVQEVVNHITREYDVDYANAESDIINFLQEMMRKNLIIIQKSLNPP